MTLPSWPPGRRSFRVGHDIMGTPGQDLGMTRWMRPVAAALPALLLAGLGLAHPHHLGTPTAALWWQLHVVLLPLFPLLAVVLWWLLRGERGPLTWAARVAAYGYATFYTGLDALAGIAAGYAVASIGEPTQVTLDLRSLGNDLGTVGAYAFVAAAVLTVVVLVRRDGQAAVPGAVLLVAGAVPYAAGHVYWPVGGLGLLAIAVGSALLAAVRPAVCAPAGSLSGRAVIPVMVTGGGAPWVPG